MTSGHPYDLALSASTVPRHAAPSLVTDPRREVAPARRGLGARISGRGRVGRPLARGGRPALDAREHVVERVAQREAGARLPHLAEHLLVEPARGLLLDERGKGVRARRGGVVRDGVVDGAHPPRCCARVHALLLQPALCGELLRVELAHEGRDGHQLEKGLLGLHRHGSAERLEERSDHRMGRAHDGRPSVLRDRRQRYGAHHFARRAAAFPQQRERSGGHERHDGVPRLEAELTAHRLELGRQDAEKYDVAPVQHLLVVRCDRRRLEVLRQGRGLGGAARGEHDRLRRHFERAEPAHERLIHHANADKAQSRARRYGRRAH
mmetsp:Transcript_49742/g.161858  ORF Transcript_49742/g.161858 Transcript_49742/m.161858 type:complete len:323 (-) Transcript_49742:90-1058(-)